MCTRFVTRVDGFNYMMDEGVVRGRAFFQHFRQSNQGTKLCSKMRRIGIAIDMTPMVDVAFLLLIFFVIRLGQTAGRTRSRCRL